MRRCTPCGDESSTPPVSPCVPAVQMGSFSAKETPGKSRRMRRLRLWTILGGVMLTAMVVSPFALRAVAQGRGSAGASPSLEETATSGEGAAPTEGGTDLLGANGLSVGWTMWLVSGLVVCFALLSYALCRRYRREIARIHEGIQHLSSREQVADYGRFTFPELGGFAQDLSNTADWLRKERVRLTEDAASDALTGLPNRRSLVNTLVQEVAAATRAGWPLSVIMLDLDHFKVLNDTYGHQAGDFVLKRTSERMASLIRQSDTLARFGGEEFAVVLPRADLDQAVDIARQLRDALRCDLLVLEDQSMRVTASFGVAEMTHCQALDPDALVKAADVALYQAKTTGRDKVVAAKQVLREESDAPEPANHSADSPTTCRKEARGADRAIDGDAMSLMGSTFSILRVIPDTRRVAQDALQQVTAALGCRHATLALMDDESESLVVVAKTGVSSYESEAAPRVSSQLAAWFAAYQEADDFGEIRHIVPELVASASTDDPFKVMRLPLIVDQELIGAIEVNDLPEDFKLKKRHQRLLSAICLIGAAALKACARYRNQEERWTGLAQVLCHALQADDVYRRGHALRVSDLAVRLGRALGINDEDELRLLRIGGLVLDVGSIGTPKRIREKKGRLRDSERQLAQEHAAVGAELIQRIPGMERLSTIVRHHHEHYDGSGYPERLAGDEIPLASKVLATADAYEAMTSDRPFRKAMSSAMALAKIQNASGSQFDPVVVDALFAVCAESRECRPSSSSVSRDP